MQLEQFMNKFGPKDYGPEVYELDHPSAPKVGGLDSFIGRFTGFTESFFFYNNTVELRYNDDSHTYWLVEELGNLTEQDGVTKTVRIIDASDMLVPWSAKVAMAKLLRLVPTEMIEGIMRIKSITFEDFTTIAMEAKSAHKDKLEEAGDIGHLAHKCLEESIKHCLVHDPEKIVRNLINVPTDDRARTAADNAKLWMDQHHVRWVETESKIYSWEHRYAGTMDGLAYVDSCNDKACCPHAFKDRLSLIDWKSSNYLKIEYLFQTASYKHAKQEEFTDLKIVDIWILRLGKNEDEAGKFEPWHMGPEDFDICFQGFLACLRLTRVVREVEERMKEQKKLIRQFRKEARIAAKILKQEQEKLAKAMKKAEDKKARETEKARIKAEAKATREAAKAAKKAAKPQIVADIKEEEQCTSISSTGMIPDSSSQATELVSTIPTEDGSKNQSTCSANLPCHTTPQKLQEEPQQIKSIISTGATDENQLQAVSQTTEDVGQSSDIPSGLPTVAGSVETVQTDRTGNRKRQSSIVFEEPRYAKFIVLPGEK